MGWYAVCSTERGGNVKKLVALSLILGCLALAGCQAEEKTPLTTPSRSTDPINRLPTAPAEPVEITPTPVYATVFEGTVFLATYPVRTWPGKDGPDCGPTRISEGGQIACGGEHEEEFPITQVIILEKIRPQSTANWFEGLSSLQEIQGLERLDRRFVTDMTDMFTDCAYQPLPSWYETQ